MTAVVPFVLLLCISEVYSFASVNYQKRHWRRCGIPPKRGNDPPEILMEWVTCALRWKLGVVSSISVVQSQSADVELWRPIHRWNSTLLGASQHSSGRRQPSRRFWLCGHRTAARPTRPLPEPGRWNHQTSIRLVYFKWIPILYQVVVPRKYHKPMSSYLGYSLIPLLNCWIMIAALSCWLNSIATGSQIN